MADTVRPVLAIDVDGVLNAISNGPPPAGWEDTRVQGYQIRYNPGHGDRLLAIAAETGAELAWCTTWQEQANQYIRHLVGLPQLPWVPLEPGRAGLKFSEYRSVGAIKATALRAWAGDRPVCWLEDEPDAAAELASWSVPHLVVRVDESAGLQERHLQKARSWLLGLAAAAAEGSSHA